MQWMELKVEAVRIFECCEVDEEFLICAHVHVHKKKICVCV